jgi:glycosyltransferase involved in cell wall biosynthesis
MLALTRYTRLAASSRQRLLLFLPDLATGGIETTVAPLLDDAHMEGLAAGARAGPLAAIRAYARRLSHLRRLREYELVWIQYELFPYLPGFVEQLGGWLGGRSGVPFVVDYDDAIFLTYDRHSNPIVRGILGGKLEPLVSRASAVTVGNAYLGAWAERLNPRVCLLPTVVDTAHYRVVERPDGAPPVVGWIGSPSTWPYVADILPAIRPVLERHGARMLVVGAGPGAEGIAGVETRRWAEERESDDVAAMDVGIMPVPDTPWGQGKCGYKLIQYMTGARAVVASPVGVNGSIVEDGETGFLAGDADAWRDRLDRLLADPALRRRMGQAGRVRAEAHYSRAAIAPRLVSLLREVGSGR